MEPGYHMNFGPQNVPMVSLCVGDLHPEVTDDDLLQAFSEFGSLSSVKVCRDFTTANKSLCYGFINFLEEEDAIQAIKTKNHMLLHGQAIRLMWSSRGSEFRRNGIGNVFVKNLDKSVDNGRLQNMFREFGTIMSCKVAVSEDGSSKGYGFVQFETQISADSAIKALNGKDINGKNIYVAPFVPKAVRSLPSPDAPFTNLYVKNLELDVTEQQFSEMFSKFGKISSVAIPADEHGSSKGFGFVSFDNPDDARHAAEAMNGFQLGSKVLYVGRAQKKAERQLMLRRQFEEKRQEQMQKYQGCNVYVKKIDDSVNEDMLRELFSQCGAITSVKLMLHPKGISRGFGFVCFSTPEEANKAVNTFHSYMFHGKPLYVAIAQRKEERRAQLQMQYGQQLTGYVGPLSPPVMTGGYSPPPVYFPAPPAIVPHCPQRPGFIYQPPMGLRPGWRGNTYVPPARPTFQTHRPPMYAQIRARMNGNAPAQWYPQPRDYSNTQRNGQARYHSNGQVRVVNNGTNLLPHNPNPVELSSFVAAAEPSQQKQILGQRLLPLVKQHQPDLAAKITGMLLEMDITELLWLVDSPSSLAEKVNEAFNVLQSAKSKDCSQESVGSVLAAKVAVS